MNDGTQSFWEHLDDLRTVLIRSALVVVLFSAVAFIFKEELFCFVLAPKEESFVTYRLLGLLADRFGVESAGGFRVELINTGLAGQFAAHIKASFCVGILCASPYILYEIFCFVAPALYGHERRLALRTVVPGYLMFILGAAASYFVVFPMTFRFLGTYQVSGDVVNMIGLESYMSTFIILALCMGAVFEMPVLAWLFARAGIVSASVMKKYRKHSVVAIMSVAAVITPTSDALTLLVVSLPMWLLYEASVFLVSLSEKRRKKEADCVGLA